MNTLSIGKKFSVIIRTKNEERWVGHTIQSVLDFFPGAEIIIIDNNSTDKTIDICKMFSRPNVFKKDDNNSYSKFKFETIKNYTPGKALNRGIALSSRNNIIVISSHCVIKKINYQKLIKDLKKYVGVFGKQTPIYLGKKIQKRYVWSNFASNRSENFFSKIENRYFFHNAFSFFAKIKIKKNLFDEELFGKEDRYWAKEIVSKKLKYLYEPSHEVEHHYTENGNTWKGLG
jgi:glycosyltransferase involved in cell wall biosynthesis